MARRRGAGRSPMPVGRARGTAAPSRNLPDIYRGGVPATIPRARVPATIPKGGVPARMAPPPKGSAKLFAGHGKKVAAAVAIGALGYGMIKGNTGRAVDKQTGLPRGMYGY